MKNITIIILALTLFSCKKQDKWLDVKSNKADVTPITLEDFQALLDNDAVMNASYPGLGLLGSDNYYMTYNSWKALLNAQERNAYLWKPDIFENAMSFDWNYEYKRVEYANIVLDGINKIVVNNSNKLSNDRIKGSALFYRAYSFYNLLQLFSAPYDSSTAMKMPGIVIRLNSDVNEKSIRSSIAQGYNQVISDLLTAKVLLPSLVSSKLKPSKTAALALLARVSLTMKNYTEAIGYATDALNIQNDLIDFNNLNGNGTNNMLPAFPSVNSEIIFYAESLGFSVLTRSNMRIDTILYKLYDNFDLRRTVFYIDNGEKGISFRGAYTGTIYSNKFSGLATNELYLIRAECNTRLNKVTEALADINHLLQNRWKTGTYVPLTGTDPQNILSTIIQERRKELPFTGNLRWEDLRRLNQEPLFAKTLTRLMNGETFSLPPNDKRYVYPIPEDEIRLSGIEQNQR